MRREKSAKQELLIAMLSTAVAAVGAFQLMGQPARAVHILTIFAGGLGAGAGIARAVMRLRSGRPSEVKEPPVMSP